MPRERGSTAILARVRAAIFTVKHKTLEYVCCQTSKRVTFVLTYESGQVLTAHESCLV